MSTFGNRDSEKEKSKKCQRQKNHWCITDHYTPISRACRACGYTFLPLGLRLRPSRCSEQALSRGPRHYARQRIWPRCSVLWWLFHRSPYLFGMDCPAFWFPLDFHYRSLYLWSRCPLFLAFSCKTLFWRLLWCVVRPTHVCSMLKPQPRVYVCGG